jgi:hypothetical protein
VIEVFGLCIFGIKTMQVELMEIPDLFLDITLGSVVPRAEIGSAHSTVPTKYPDPAQPSASRRVQTVKSPSVYGVTLAHPKTLGCFWLARFPSSEENQDGGAADG